MILVQWTGTKDTLKKVKCHRMYISFGQPTGQQNNQSISCWTDGDEMIERKQQHTRTRHHTQNACTQHTDTNTESESKATGPQAQHRVISEACAYVSVMPQATESSEMCLQPSFGFTVIVIFVIIVSGAGSWCCCSCCCCYTGMISLFPPLCMCARACVYTCAYSCVWVSVCTIGIASIWSQFLGAILFVRACVYVCALYCIAVCVCVCVLRALENSAHESQYAGCVNTISIYRSWKVRKLTWVSVCVCLPVHSQNGISRQWRYFSIDEIIIKCGQASSLVRSNRFPFSTFSIPHSTLHFVCSFVSISFFILCSFSPIHCHTNARTHAHIQIDISAYNILFRFAIMWIRIVLTNFTGWFSAFVCQPPHFHAPTLSHSTQISTNIPIELTFYVVPPLSHFFSIHNLLKTQIAKDLYKPSHSFFCSI